MRHAMVNIAKWAELPLGYQAIISTASQATNCDMQARYYARNPAALNKLVGPGAKLAPYPQDVHGSLLQCREGNLCQNRRGPTQRSRK